MLASPNKRQLSKQLLIRPFEPEDASALARLFHAAVWQTAARHYSPAQRAAWSPQLPNAASYRQKAADGRIFLVAVNAAGEAIAYGDIATDGHLDHLYCRPDASGTGVAATLYDALEQAAVAAGITRLYVEASETARGLFERKGFSCLVRQQLIVRGVSLHNYRMAKSLRGA